MVVRTTSKPSLKFLKINIELTIKILLYQAKALVFVVQNEDNGERERITQVRQQGYKLVII